MKVIGSKGKRDVGLEPKKSQLKETVVGKWRIEKQEWEKSSRNFLLEQGRKDPTLHIFQKQDLLIFVDFFDSPAFIASHNWLEYFFFEHLCLYLQTFSSIWNPSKASES